MKVKFESKGSWDKTLSWLSRASSRAPTTALTRIAENGIQQLKSNTPKDTGATASGWDAEVTIGRNKSEVSWYNRAHPEAGVNVAKIIDQGHGTRNGGYVPPRPYIQSSMDKVFKDASNMVAKEMIK